MKSISIGLFSLTGILPLIYPLLLYSYLTDLPPELNIVGLRIYLLRIGEV